MGRTAVARPGDASRAHRADYGDRPIGAPFPDFFTQLDRDVLQLFTARTIATMTPLRLVAGLPESADTLYAGELEIRLGEGLVLATGRALTLSVREFELLVAMARRAGAIVTREELYSAVWGGELRAGDRSVDVYVSKLRGKLEKAMPDRRFIHTHPGFGYRFQPQPPRARLREGRARRKRPHRDGPAFTKCSHRSGRRLTRLVPHASDRHRTPLPAASPDPGRRPTSSIRTRRSSDPEQDRRARRLSSLLALGLAACGSSSSTQPSSRRHDLGRRLDIRGPRLRAVGLVRSPA